MHDTSNYRTPDVLELLGYAELEARVIDLQSERNTYRDLAREGLAALHKLTEENKRLRKQVAELREGIEYLREAA